MGKFGKCCCCKLKREDLPDWQIAGYEVTTDWNNERLGVKSCCWERTYTAIGNFNAGLIFSPDVTRFWVNEQSRVDAKALDRLVAWIWKGMSAPTTLPPGSLCPLDAGLIGYTTCEVTEELKRRGYLYYQPWRISLALSDHIDRCDTEEPKRRIYTMSVRVEFRSFAGVQTFYRSCMRRNFFVTHPCYERNTRPDLELGCDTTNLDYESLQPPSEFVGWKFGTDSIVTIRQFTELPVDLSINSHNSPITQQQWVDCIADLANNCHAIGPGVIAGQQSCWVFDSSNVDPIPDSTPYLQIVTMSQQECQAHGDCSAPTFGYDFPWRVFCTDTLMTARVNTVDPPLCTLTWNALQIQTSAPPGANTTAFCRFPTGDPRFAEIWYQQKAGVTCCTQAVPCPSDGEPGEGGDGGIGIGIGGGGGPPPGYQSGWYGGVRCTQPGKWSQHSYSVSTEYLPTTARTLCIPPFDFLLDSP